MVSNNEKYVNTAVCRTCLNGSSECEMKSLFVKVPFMEITFADMLMACASINISDFDKFPQCICQNCIVKLQSAYEFELICRESDKILKNSIFKESNLQCEIKNEVDHMFFDNEIKSELEYKDCNKNEMLNEHENNWQDLNIDVKSEHDVLCDDSDEDTMKLNIDDAYYSKRLVNNKNIVICLVQRECNYCFQEFESFQQLQSHVKIAHKIDLIFYCPLCKKKFKTYVSFYKHTNIHQNLTIFDKLEILTDPIQNQWRCCKISFKNHVDIYNHVLKVHKLYLIYKCAVCNEIFKCLTKLQKHMKNTQHNYIKQYRRHLCWICGKKYLSGDDFKQHLYIHNGEKPYICIDCGKAYSSKGNLRMHRSLHEITNRTCEICGKIFDKYKRYYEHKKLHTKKCVHKCVICEKQFNQNKHLKRHMISHTGAKDHECEVCGNKFAYKKGLKIHRLIHTGEKPKVCHICGTKFRQQTSLKLHMKKHKID